MNNENQVTDNTAPNFPTIEWNKVIPRNPEQQIVLDWFAQFSDFHPNNLTGNNLRDVIKEEFSLFQLSRVEVMMNSGLFKYIRHFIEARGMPIPDYAGGRNWITIRVIKSIFHEDVYENDIRSVVLRYEAYKEGNLPTANGGATHRQLQTPNRQGNEEVNRRLFSENHNTRNTQPNITFAKFTANYRSDESKFGGELREDLNTQLQQYDRIAHLNNLTAEQKLLFIPAMLKGEAANYYYNNLTGLQSYREVVQALMNRYQNPARTRAIDDAIRELSIYDFMKTEDGKKTNEGSALLKLASKIERLVPQASRHRRGDLDKREALYHAVKGMPWAQPALSGIASNPNKTYKDLLSELATLQANNSTMIKEQQAHRHNSKIVTDTIPQPFIRTYNNNKGSTDAINWYQGQARYGRDPRAPRRTHNQHKHDKKCYNCGDKTHMLPNCPKPRDENRITKHRISDLLRSKSSDAKIEILKRLLSEQSKYVNYLSQALYDTMYDSSNTNTSDDDSSSQSSSYSEDSEESSIQQLEQESNFITNDDPKMVMYTDTLTNSPQYAPSNLNEDNNEEKSHFQ